VQERTNDQILRCNSNKERPSKLHIERELSFPLFDEKLSTTVD
jgi:hypothetical protein